MFNFKDWHWLTYNFEGSVVKTQTPPETRHILFDRVSKIKDGTIVEIGVFGGANLLHLAGICNLNNNKLIGIDPWDNVTKEHFTPETLEFLKTLKTDLFNVIKKHNLKIELLELCSYDAYHLFKDKSITLLFLDADHSFESVYKDIQQWMPKTKLMLGDDFYWNSVKMATNKYCQDNGLTLKELNERTWELSNIG